MKHTLYPQIAIAVCTDHAGYIFWALPWVYRSLPGAAQVSIPGGAQQHSHSVVGDNIDLLDDPLL